MAPKNNEKKTSEKEILKQMNEPPFPLYVDAKLPSFREGWESVVRLLRGRKNIVVLTGAGISVSCGIPDFRSKDSGLYSTLDTEELGLSCPEDIFDASFFQENPSPFYRFAKNIYFPLLGKDGQTDAPGNEPKTRLRPSDSHKLLSLLEQKKKLLRVYSQNIDGLEEMAGVSSKRVVYAHGSLQYFTCSKCKRKVNSKDVEKNILEGSVAFCQAPVAPMNAKTTTTYETTIARERSARISLRKRPRYLVQENQTFINSDGLQICGGVMKPGVTMFGEALNNNVKTRLESDRKKVDALIVIGTSLSVAPISKVIKYLPANIPRILINRTIVHPPEEIHGDCIDDDNNSTDSEDPEFRNNYVFDAYCLGFCDDITRALGTRLLSGSGGPTPHIHEVDERGELLATIAHSGGDDSAYSLEDWEKVGIPHERVFLFPGAEAPTGSEEVAFREIAHCDGCSKRIIGTIRKCVECFDYDLCQECYPKVSKMHYEGNHQFIDEASLPANSTLRKQRD